MTENRLEARLDGVPADRWVLSGGERGDQATGANPLASLEQLASEVGLEFSQPLQIIAFAVDELRDALIEGDRAVVDQCLEGIESQIQRGAGFLGRLLAFSRSDARPLEPADLNDLVSRAVCALHGSLVAARIDVEIILGEAIPRVACCQGELVQAIINVVLNARDAVRHREGGRISVRTFGRERQVCVEITDNGEGIAEQHLTRIFDPFFTTKPVGEGTGLGLSIARGIMRRHGGNIEALAKVGEGARVRVTLPVPDVADLHDDDAPSQSITH